MAHLSKSLICKDFQCNFASIQGAIRLFQRLKDKKCECTKILRAFVRRLLKSAREALDAGFDAFKLVTEFPKRLAAADHLLP